MVRWNHKTNEADKVRYNAASTIGIMVKDTSLDKNNVLFEKIIEEYFDKNKIENLALVEEVSGGVTIDSIPGSESLYKGKLQGIDDEELMVDIVTFENDGKQYFLILSSVGKNMEADFQGERDEFYEFIKSIKIGSK